MTKADIVAVCPSPCLLNRNADLSPWAERFSAVNFLPAIP